MTDSSRTSRVESSGGRVGANTAISQSMMIEEVTQAALSERLDVFGLLHADPDDGIGEGTIVLLGPAEPGFWPYVTATPEFGDGKPDPLDRWSARVVRRIAANAGGEALLPFGAPARPFARWALRSGQAFVSPALLLVHARVGLFVSFRGAILLPELLELPKPPPRPCDTCKGKPCIAGLSGLCARQRPLRPTCLPCLP